MIPDKYPLFTGLSDISDKSDKNIIFFENKKK